MTNLDVSRAVAPTHFFPPDPSSQVVCSIGGNVAENSGGAHCFKYGFTTNYVTGLEVVLPDGEVVVLGGEPDRPGYDLLGRVRRLGGHARRRHPDHAAGDPGPGGGADAARLLRGHRGRRAGRVRHRRRGRDPERDRDDGPAGDRGDRGRHPRRLPARRRRRAAGRARRPAGRVRRLPGDGERTVRAPRRDGGARRPRRGRARARVAGAQGGVRRDGPHLPHLLRAGRRRPAHAAARGAGAHRGARGRVRAAGGQRVPRRRRQPAPARLLPRGRRRPCAPRSSRG